MSMHAKSAVEPSLLLTVREVAQLLGCSPRHVYRMTDAGKFPRPIKFGTLVRWPRSTVESWVGAIGVKGGVNE